MKSLYWFLVFEASTASSLWPDENNLEIPLDILTQVKASKITTSGIIADLTYYDVSTSGEISDTTVDLITGVPVNDIDPENNDIAYRIAVKGNPEFRKYKNLNVRG